MANKATPDPLGAFDIVLDPPKPQNRSQRQNLSPLDRFREAIDTQLAAFDAAGKGETLRIQRGSRSTRVRPWWYEVEGAYFIQVRYGAQPLDLDGQGHSTIRVGPREQIPLVLAKLREAVEAGAFNDQLALASQRQSVARKKAADKTRTELGSEPEPGSELRDE
ncbi:MAG: hypothetical protein GVY30_01015 [Chloroflexi bacterium]|jgi:hypothetical protein|nr:hypothetical protein [Chloroflexota bacterium]